MPSSKFGVQTKSPKDRTTKTTSIENPPLKDWWNCSNSLSLNEARCVSSVQQTKHALQFKFDDKDDTFYKKIFDRQRYFL